ncbi:MAG: DNA polymerase III subunit gamma/tau [Bacteroidota bacterium]
MESYIVSARKYRPNRFDKVVGQQNITNTLKNAIKHDHLAQAFLFSGPRGVGKTTVARLMAKTLNCTNVTEDVEPCNECESCKTFNDSASFNVHELDAASNNSVEDIRSLVDQVRIPPQSGKYKVYIIDEVHMLSTAAFNAFLKTLEEPPSYAKFILATTEKHKIIPTILSRCQSYDFQRIPVDQIRDHLALVAAEEKVEAESEALHMIAQKADGALRDALSIFDQVVNFAGGHITYQHVIENLNILDYDYYFRLTDYILQGNIPDSLLLFEEISIKGFAGQQFLSGFGSHLRNMLICRDEKTIQLLEVGAQIRSKYLEYAQKFDPTTLLQMIDTVNKADLNYRSANNKRLQIELALMQVCSYTSTPEKKTSVKNESKSAPLKPPQKKDTEAPKQQQKQVEKPASTVTPSSESTKQSQAPEPVTKQPVKTSEEKEKETRLNKNVHKLPTISLKDEPEPEKKGIEQEEEKAQTSTPAKEFTIEDIKSAMKAYADKEREQKPSFITDLENSQPQINNTNTITITLTNKIYAEKNFVLDLQKFFRGYLENPHITVEAKYQADKAQKKAFTSKEKYESMKTINPEVENFKNQLDLDYE